MVSGRKAASAAHGARASGAARRVMTRLGKAAGSLRKAIMIAVALVCLAAGAISLPLPLPFGFLLLTVGLALLAANSERAQRWLHETRTNTPWLDARLMQIASYLPGPLRRALIPFDSQ